MRTLILEQMESEELFAEVENDEDFTALDEEDVFDSDFESSDEDEAVSDEDAVLAEEEQRQEKAGVFRKEKVVERELTQQEKLEEAKETERKNTESLQSLLLLEEETKRKQVKKTTQHMGPTIRWHSFTESAPEEPPDVSIFVDVDGDTVMDLGPASGPDDAKFDDAAGSKSKHAS
ncbi:hypothetical protein HDV00_007636 [Rhizophlyctis rosea]|nr:hypothetical protein HDV00_007636 [Rhizophlyctis rosea]